MKEQVLAVQRMQDYMQAHLKQGIFLSDLPKEFLYLPWHSYRLFQSCTGQTPTEYIRRPGPYRPRVQLEPRGERDYIELRAVKR